jgi:hypothetical protein
MMAGSRLKIQRRKITKMISKYLISMMKMEILSLRLLLPAPVRMSKSLILMILATEMIICLHSLLLKMRRPRAAKSKSSKPGSTTSALLMTCTPRLQDCGLQDILKMGLL